MKKVWWIIAAVAAAVLFVACPNPAGNGDNGNGEPEPMPPTFLETVSGKIWMVEGIELYQDTRSLENPYRKGVCMYFQDDGNISFWIDANDDGLLSPSEQVDGLIPYSEAAGMLTIGGDVWSVDSFDASGWSISADVTGTTIGDWLGGPGDPYEGYVRVHYVPCMKGLDDQVLTYSFAFVFDDMGDTTAEWMRRKCRYWLDINFDWCDGFYFTSGTPLDSYLEDSPILGNHVMVISYHDGFYNDIDTAILIANKVYGLDMYDVPAGFKPDHVYDMTITVDSADAGNMAFVSRVDGHAFDVDVTLDRSEMGAVIIRGVDDADVPVVNP